MSIKIETLTAISDVASTDLLIITDVSDSNSSHKVTVGNLLTPTGATLSSNGTHLTAGPSIYWVQTEYDPPYEAYLPDPSLMTNRTLIFVTYGYSEGNFSILPYGSETIQGSSSYAMNGPGSSVTLLCDGTNWFITASASNF